MTALRLLIVAVSIALCSAPVSAQPVGVDSCDTFLTAYSACAASPGVPAGARPGLEQGIESMRNSFRTTAAQPGTTDTLRAQCKQMHAQMRQSMNMSFKCTMPEP